MPKSYTDNLTSLLCRCHFTWRICQNRAAVYLIWKTLIQYPNYVHTFRKSQTKQSLVTRPSIWNIAITSWLCAILLTKLRLASLCCIISYCLRTALTGLSHDTHRCIMTPIYPFPCTQTPKYPRYHRSSSQTQSHRERNFPRLRFRPLSTNFTWYNTLSLPSKAHTTSIWTLSLLLQYSTAIQVYTILSARSEKTTASKLQITWFLITYPFHFIRCHVSQIGVLAMQLLVRVERHCKLLAGCVEQVENETDMRRTGRISHWVTHCWNKVYNSQ